MKNITIIAILLASINIIFAGNVETLKFNVSTDTVRPILLDKSILSGVGLKKIDLKQTPNRIFHQKRLYKGDDLSIYVVATETWNTDNKSFPFDEFVYMFYGEAEVRSATGKVQNFYSGDYFFAPKGFKGDWEIKAGEHLHYELSVISTQRADSVQMLKFNASNPNTSDHILFDSKKLSGTHINLNEKNTHSEILKKGIELTVRLNAETPQEKQISTPAKEQMIQVLSGMISLTDETGATHIFYAKDFFVLPKGFTGIWKSEGHSLVKYLSVERSRDVKF